MRAFTLNAVLFVGLFRADTSLLRTHRYSVLVIHLVFDGFDFGDVSDTDTLAFAFTEPLKL